MAVSVSLYNPDVTTDFLTLLLPFHGLSATDTCMPRSIHVAHIEVEKGNLASTKENLLVCTKKSRA